MRKQISNNFSSDDYEYHMKQVYRMLENNMSLAKMFIELAPESLI